MASLVDTTSTAVVAATNVAADRGEVKTFEMGQVVMARMDGYFYWPGIVSCDPEKFVHEKLGQLHVSFLDEPPSRGWVPLEEARPFESAAEAESFVDAREEDDSKIMNDFLKRFRRKCIGYAAEAKNVEEVDKRVERFLELQEFSPPGSDDEDEAHLAKAQFPVGTVVLAKMRGYPIWPALVSLDPLRHVSILSRSIHVHFFDKPMTRGWASIKGLRYFSGHSDQVLEMVDDSYKKDGRMKEAIKMGKEALKMTSAERYKQFIMGEIGSGRDDDKIKEVVQKVFFKVDDWEKELQDINHNLVAEKFDDDDDGSSDREAKSSTTSFETCSTTTFDDDEKKSTATFEEEEYSDCSTQDAISDVDSP